MKTTAATGVAGHVQCITVRPDLQQKPLLPVFPNIHSVVDKK